MTLQSHKIKEDSDCAHRKLLALYFDAKSMTSGDIFNKFKLNGALREYTKEQNGRIFDMLLSAAGVTGADEQEALCIIINGAFEKLCNEKKSPDGVIDRLVNLLW